MIHTNQFNEYLVQSLKTSYEEAVDINKIKFNWPHIHYGNGHIYIPDNISRNEEHQNLMIEYYDHTTRMRFSRPLKVWLDKVNVPGYSNPVNRFTEYPVLALKDIAQ